MTARALFLILLLLQPGAAAYGRTVTISSGEYPPWTGAKLPQDGYVNHVIRESFAIVGIKTKFVYLPWKRAFEDARKGSYDATSYWFDDHNRRSVMFLSEPVIQNRTVFFQRSEDKPIEWQKLSDLSDYRMSATVGFTYTEEFYEAIVQKELQVTMVPTDVQNIKMLMSRRVDLVATDEMSGFYMAATLSVDPRKLRVLEPALATPQGYLMATKNDPASEELIATFNRGLKMIQANGTYKQIINRVDNTSFYDPGVDE